MKKIVIFLSLLFFLGGIFFLRTPMVFSAIEVPVESVNPGDDYKYVIKRLKEKLRLYFFSVSAGKKVTFLSKLVDVRLSELKYVVEKKDIANFQTASQRYSATAGNAADFVLKKGGQEDKQKLIEKFLSHVPVLTKLQEPYIPDNSEWRFLQDDINSLDSYVSKLLE